MFRIYTLDGQQKAVRVANDSDELQLVPVSAVINAATFTHFLAARAAAEVLRRNTNYAMHIVGMADPPDPR